jgi:ABC-type nickel/cobalt efflux system permease component RcnA
VRYNHKQTSRPLNFGLALTAGLGLLVMITALAVGVVQGESADSRTVGFTLVTGLALLFCGFVGWLIVVRPFDHFDNIDIPKDTGHAHTPPETAIVAQDSDTKHAVEPVRQH